MLTRDRLQDGERTTAYLLELPIEPCVDFGVIGEVHRGGVRGTGNRGAVVAPLPVVLRKVDRGHHRRRSQDGAPGELPAPPPVRPLSAGPDRVEALLRLHVRQG